MAERDLRSLVDAMLNMSQQCAFAAKKVTGVLGYVRQSIDSRMKEEVLCLYLALMRPHLQYHVQFWAPQYKKDMGIPERVQRSVTIIKKEVENLTDFTDEERPREVGLYSLEQAYLLYQCI